MTKQVQIVGEKVRRILIETEGAYGWSDETVSRLVSLLAQSQQEAVGKSKEELLSWIRKTSVNSARAGVLGYDFVSRLEKKLEREVFEALQKEEK